MARRILDYSRYKFYSKPFDNGSFNYFIQSSVKWLISESISESSPLRNLKFASFIVSSSITFWPDLLSYKKLTRSENFYSFTPGITYYLKFGHLKISSADLKSFTESLISSNSDLNIFNSYSTDLYGATFACLYLPLSNESSWYSKDERAQNPSVLGDIVKWIFISDE